MSIFSRVNVIKVSLPTPAAFYAKIVIRVSG